ncbi:potassium channel family protein [Patulibacter americanus]|uniref:potassium channel family protein n=1 Tax=Patulibacter americanus TaxID=588672 RepID=UPI0003B4CCFC|nr:potassium channel family protein [Patulibacter americanus]
MPARFDVLSLRILGWFGRRPIRNLLLYLLLVVLIAAALYSLTEGAEINYADGLWWAVVTLTTVGYGDISPASIGMRMVAVWVMASGLLSVAAITGVVAARMSVAALAEADATQGIDDDFEHLSNDLADAVMRVKHLQERFRLDERGDDRVCAAAREVVERHRAGTVDDAAIDRLAAAVDAQRATDA